MSELKGETVFRSQDQGSLAREAKFELALKDGEGEGSFGNFPPLSPIPVSWSPVHDDVHVAAVPLEAGAQQDVVPPGEAHLHGEVGHHLGVGLQHGLQLQQGLLGLLSVLNPGGQTQTSVRDLQEVSHEALRGLLLEGISA